MLADELDYVLGVDTHRDEHVMAVVTAPAGAVVAGAAAPANAHGYRELLRVAEQHAPGRRAWAIEGTGSYGAGLCRYLHGRGESVLEVSRIPRGERRLRGKDDALDAARTARAALASDTLALPRTGERREALRLLLVARRSAVDVRREALTQLRAVIVTAPELLRHELCRLPQGKLLDRCSRFRRTSSAGADELATRIVLRSLARRVRTATVEADELEREILAHVRALAPTLLDEPGVGPIVAAQLIVAWSHHGRLRSEACFARLAGVAPVPASSGQPPGTVSAAAATANSIAPSTRSSSTAANTTRQRATTSPAASPKGKAAATPPAYSSATSPATSTGSSNNRNR
jgi:transposase